MSPRQSFTDFNKFEFDIKGKIFKYSTLWKVQFVIQGKKFKGINYPLKNLVCLPREKIQRYTLWEIHFVFQGKIFKGSKYPLKIPVCLPRKGQNQFVFQEEKNSSLWKFQLVFQGEKNQILFQLSE